MNKEKYSCQYHGRTEGHPIQKCLEFLKLVQVMTNEGEIDFCEKIKEQNVSVLLEEFRKPVTIFIEGKVSK